jgi:hypothetical protein
MNKKKQVSTNIDKKKQVSTNIDNKTAIEEDDNTQQNEKYLYLVEKYNQYELYKLDELINGEKQWNAWKNPNTDHTPECSVCLSKFNEFKKLLITKPVKIEIELEHTTSCLWYDYFTRKMIQLAGNIEFKISRKINKDKFLKQPMTV